MKRAIIIFALMLIITLAVPAIVCFTDMGTSESSDLVNIFRGQTGVISYIECCRLFPLF